MERHPSPGETIAATRSWTRSAASTGSRSAWFPAQRYSMTKFRPSTQPVWLKPRRRPVSRGASDSGDPKFKYPITGIACSARAASGHAAAPQISVMNARRFISRKGIRSLTGREHSAGYLIAADQSAGACQAPPISARSGRCRAAIEPATQWPTSFLPCASVTLYAHAPRDSAELWLRARASWAKTDGLTSR